MTQEALLREYNEVLVTLSKLKEAGLHSFRNDFMNLYNNVIFEYEGKKEDSDFYHVRKILERMGNFNEVPERRKGNEMSEIRSMANAALRDLYRLILQMKLPGSR